jgi:hypothetical protein
MGLKPTAPVITGSPLGHARICAKGQRRVPVWRSTVISAASRRSAGIVTARNDHDRALQ